MRILLITAALIYMTFFASVIPGSAEQPAKIFYVAVNGNDNNPGTIAKPFATLKRARDAVRRLKRYGNIPKDGVIIYIRGGVYYLKETLAFGPEDSPPLGTAITYCAYPGEKPVFSAGVNITNWEKLKEEPDELHWQAHGKVWTADIPETKNGKWRFYTLFDGDERLPRARCNGFAPAVPFDRSVQSGDDTLRFPKGKIKNWSNLEDVEVVIRPKYPWVLNILGLRSVDEINGVAVTAIPGTYPLIGLGHVRDNSISCWVENVLEALDEPGEWALNTQEGRLYLLPRGDCPGNTVFAPCLKELIRIEGDEADRNPVRNLVFRGLTFTHGDRDLWTKDDAGLQHDWEMFDKANALVRLRGAENITVEKCRFINSGGTAIRLDLYCQKNRIIGNYIAYMGGTGILLCGYGPGTKDVNKYNEIINNHIHHCGEIYLHSLGIFVWQSGENRIANNLVHHMPYTGIVVSGVRPGFFKIRDRRECSRTIRWDEVGDAADWDEIMPFLHARNNIIENNEIYRVMEVMGDGNGIYISGAGEGNVIRRNYIHHIFGDASHTGLRTDDYQRGTLITENIVFHCVMGGFTLKHHNNVENNIFVDILEDGKNFRRTRFYGYIILRRGPSTGAKIQRNIFCHLGGEIPFYDEKSMGRGIPSITLEDLDMDYNLYFCAEAPQYSEEYLNKLKQRGVELHSISSDPLFFDAENGDFRLAPDSPALKLGFKPIDISKIGLIK